MVLLQQMTILFILMGIGFFCGREGYMGDEFAKNLSWLVVNVATPAMILHAGMDEANTIKGKELLFGFGITLCIYAFLIVISFIIMPLLKVPKEDKSVYRVMTIFNNIGFMGLPILNATFGSEAVLYGALFQFPFNILIYTYGISALRGDSVFKGGWNPSKILNVGVVSCAISIVIYVSGLHIPSFIADTTKHLGNLCAPLSMMVIGQSMIHIRLKELFGDIRLLGFSLLKLIVVPILGVLMMKLFISDEMLLNVCFIMLATPVGSMCAMLPQQYGGNYTLASRGVAMSTVMSVVTIPLVSILLF